MTVENYRCIEDSGPVRIDGVTCLVGKNESGKTAFLQALYKLHPLETKAVYDSTFDYPSRNLAQYKRDEQAVPANVVKARFKLTVAQITEIESELGAGVLRSDMVTVSRGYGPMKRGVGVTSPSVTMFGVQLNEHVAVQTMLESHRSSHWTIGPEVATFADLIPKLHAPDSDYHSRELLEEIGEWRGKSVTLHVIDEYLSKWLPIFVYFDEYSNLPGQVEILTLIKRRDARQCSRGEQGFLRLLESAGLRLEDLAITESADYEAHIRSLEAAAGSISKEVFHFWTQNKALSVNLTTSSLDTSQIQNLEDVDHATARMLNLRIFNARHLVSMPFGERSRGFVWFFSFLAYFSFLEAGDRPIVLLLDEPGLNLHATAQADFLRFIDERLAPRHQVIYTTHSPFLINPNKLSLVRTVVDVDGVGTRVSEDVLKADSGTTFPLQAALGYELSQTLFVGPNVILLEGPSDLIYLDVLSEALRRRGGRGLDERWVKVPVGGAGKVSTFVSLLGANKSNVAVLMDASTRDISSLQKIRRSEILSRNALVTVGEILGRKDADIEDLFDPLWYLRLVAKAYPGLEIPTSLEGLPGTGERVVPRIEVWFKAHHIDGGHFNHFRPAVLLLGLEAGLTAQLPQDTLDSAQLLMDRLNELLPPS